MNLSEAEIQVLSSIQEAKANNIVASQSNLEERAQRYWIFKEDWSGAFDSLESKDLISGNSSKFQLTDSGLPLAIDYYAERPDLYWYYYQQFYDLSAKSKVHPRFCEIVFGEDRSQEGMTDMECFNDVLSRMNVRSTDSLLDLGCGAGGLSEYVFDNYGASITGIDYSASAVEVAKSRTESKRGSLDFLHADLNSLNLKNNTFDAAISIDSVYWVSDMDKSILSIAEAIRPGGKLCILIEHKIDESDDLILLESRHTRVAKSLNNLNLNYDTVDYSDLFMKFWPKVKETALSLREDYVSEGTELICDNWIREADQDYLPSVELNRIRRYLYQIYI